MKRIIALFLCITMILAGCSQSQPEATNPVSNPDTTPSTPSSEAFETVVWENVEPHYNSLDDALLLAHIEDLVYTETITALDSDEYFVESVNATYISKEYLEEVAYNSQSNIYFGYTLNELDALFQGTRYIFTLGENGDTTVQELQEIEDVNTETMLKNVAIGTGVILVCITVSVVSAGAGAPAVSMVFAFSATTAETMALSSAAFGGIFAGIVRGIQTGDLNEAIEAAAFAGSEDFKWGAISGAIVGGKNEAFLLKKATENGLTMNEAAIIQKESKWSLDAIKKIHSIDEYNIYKDANLVPTKLPDGEFVFLRQIDWTLTDAYGRTNIQRVAANLAPVDATGRPFELHHMGQKADSPLAILSWAEHHSSGNYSVLHYAEQGKDISDAAWTKQKQEIWKAILKMLQGA